MSERKLRSTPEGVASFVNYDELINRLEFNVKAAKSAMDQEEGKQPETYEALQEYVRKLEESIHKLEVTRDISQKERLDDEDVRKAMSITCYGDIGYCCGLAKVCLWRDSCCQALRIDDETYVEVKQAVIRQMLERIRR